MAEGEKRRRQHNGGRGLAGSHGERRRRQRRRQRNGGSTTVAVAAQEMVAVAAQELVWNGRNLQREMEETARVRKKWVRVLSPNSTIWPRFSVQSRHITPFGPGSLTPEA